MGLAERIAAALRPGDVLVLTGELGAGKTEFVRGLAGALGHDRDKVNSPSFTIVNEYPGDRPLYHLDLYRIKDVDELYEVGWDDYLDRDGLVVVEWGEKAAPLLPPRYYRVTFAITGETDRKVEIEAVSP